MSRGRRATRGAPSIARQAESTSVQVLIPPDTLCTPRIPVHEQYAAEAHAAGINTVTPSSVRAGFKPGKCLISHAPQYSFAIAS